MNPPHKPKTIVEWCYCNECEKYYRECYARTNTRHFSIRDEFLTLINSQVKKPYKPLTEMQFKIRMNDAGFVTVESWYQLLGELKQAKSPGACFGYKTKLK